jgi:hypothetical protein
MFGISADFQGRTSSVQGSVPCGGQLTGLYLVEVHEKRVPAYVLLSFLYAASVLYHFVWGREGA